MSVEIQPLDPDSPRGRELAREMTLLLDEIEEAIAERKAAARRGDERMDGGQAA